MKKFLFVFYVGLYAFVAGALVTVDVVSIKAGWPWLSTLVRPMGIAFLAINYGGPKSLDSFWSKIR